MVNSVAAPQARGKFAEDNIFGANNRANALAKEIGIDRVINGTVGSILDEDGNLVMRSRIMKLFLTRRYKAIRSISMPSLISVSANHVLTVFFGLVPLPAAPGRFIMSFIIIRRSAMKS